MNKELLEKLYVMNLTKHSYAKNYEHQAFEDSINQMNIFEEEYKKLEPKSKVILD